MSRTRILILILGLAVIAGSPSLLFAQNIKVDIGPGICLKQGPTPLNIGGPCGNIDIMPASAAAGNAQVEANDGVSDILQLKNSKITAIAPVNNFRIIAERQFVEPPKTSANAKVYYSTSVTGNWTPTTEANSLNVTSSVENPIPSDPRQMHNISAPGTTSPINQKPVPNTEWVPPPHLAGDRILKLEHKFTLATAGNSLTITSSSLRNTAVAEDKN